MHSRHPQVQRAGIRECPSRHQGGDNGSTHLISKGSQFLVSVSSNSAPANIENWLFGGSNHFRSNLNLFCVCFRDWVISGQIYFWGPNEGRAILLRILSYIDQHRSRSPSCGNVDRCCDHSRDFFRLGHQERMLRNRHGHTRDVHLLKSISTHRVGKNLPRNREQWHRVHVCISNSGDQVCGSGTRGGNGDTQFPG